MNKNIVSGLKALLPIPIYFVILQILDICLRKYTNAGPVSHETGQPLFSDYGAVLHYGILTLIALGLAYSVVTALKLIGWPRYATLIIAILFVPIQYIFLIALQVSLFKK